MKEWTFLLQKYGDRSWLPLDSPDMEILEGRYRIVVQTDHPNTDINIRICHLATEEDPPKRRIQKRTNRTNRNGLMVVAPFTSLPAGNWELCCFLSDPLSDLVGDVLHHAVRLRVAPCSEQEEDNWDDAPAAAIAVPAAVEIPVTEQVAADEPTADPAIVLDAPSVQEVAALNVEIAQALGVSMDRLVEMTDHLSHQLIAEIFQEFNLQAAVEPAAIAPATEAVITPPEAQPPLSETPPVMPTLDVNQLRIVLAQDGWLAARGESLAIAGRIESVPAEAVAAGLATGDANAVEPELEGAVPQELQLQLRDPQTSKVLFHACQSFPVGAAPLAFRFLCNLPEQLDTHLLLGEVMIAGVLPGAESVLVTLKTFNFTVTVDPQGLVAELQKVQSALAAQAEQDELADVVAQFSERLQKEKERQTLDLSFLNMAAPVPESMTAPETAPAIAVATPPQKSSRKQILPPLLHEPDAEQAGKRKLELPVFLGGGRTANAATSTAVAVPPVEEDVVFGDRDLEAQSMLLPELPAPISPSMAVEASEMSNGDRPAADSQPAPPQSPTGGNGQADLARLDELSSPIRSAFQALNLQDKFLTRLSSMAADDELTTLLKLTLPQPDAPTDEHAAPVAIAVEPKPVADPELETSTEVVVDDDPAWQAWIKRAGSRSQPVATSSQSEENLVNPLLLPADQSVPVPIVELGTDEIVAGQMIHIRVKLPNLLPKIYVKLWINDRQTRTLLDGPRWLVDFLPNGRDELEATTQITAPYDSMNIRVEAIAVEIQTQRESQKVSLDCEVIPADLPDDLFDADFGSF